MNRWHADQGKAFQSRVQPCANIQAAASFPRLMADCNCHSMLVWWSRADCEFVALIRRCSAVSSNVIRRHSALQYV